MALYCAFSDKASFCAQYGLTIRAEDWPAQELCNLVVADNAELLSRQCRTPEPTCRAVPAASPAHRLQHQPGRPAGRQGYGREQVRQRQRIRRLGAWGLEGPGARTRCAQGPRSALGRRTDAARIHAGARSTTCTTCRNGATPNSCLHGRDAPAVPSPLDEVLFHNNAVAIPDLLTKDVIQASVKPYRRDIYQWGLEHESGERARHADPAVLYRCLLPSRRCPLTDSGLKRPLRRELYGLRVCRRSRSRPLVALATQPVRIGPVRPPAVRGHARAAGLAAVRRARCGRLRECAESRKKAAAATRRLRCRVRPTGPPVSRHTTATP
jgi:putative transposase